MKISIKREQNDASISSAEREKFGTKFKTFKLFSMAALALVMAACSSEDNVLETATPAANGKIHFTATLPALGSGAQTRTTYTEDGTSINVAWKVDDEIALCHNGKRDVVKVKTVNGDGSATIDGTIDATGTDGEGVTLVYPAASVSGSTGATPIPNLTYAAKGLAQDGTLDYIATNLDARQGSGTLKISGDPAEATLNGSVKLQSQIAIWKLSLSDGTNPLSATAVTLKVGTTTIAQAASAAKSDYYLCVVPATMGAGDFTIEATVGSDTYTYSKSGVSLAKGNYYQSTVTMAKQAAVPAGALNGEFSVSATKTVKFSKGNLRYASGTWSFFDNQYDYFTTHDGTNWDKFCWSTSATTYGMNTSVQESDYSGDFVDWGSNSDLQTALGTGWFTLSSDEWKYLFYTRSASTVGGTSNGRYAKAKVNGVQGMILFPDTYTHPDGVTAPIGVNASGSTGWNGNNYSSADWTKMESAGCVFLPAAGDRYGSSAYNLGTTGYYWSATPLSANYALRVRFYSGDLYSAEDHTRNEGYSVRLVRDVAAPTPANKLLSAATAEDIGKVVGADGKIYTNVAAAKAAGTTACAIIAYFGSETGESQNHGLAIAMKDAAAGYLQWKTSKGSNDNPNQYTEPAPAIAAKESGSALSSGRNNSTWPAFEAALANSIDVTDGISAAAPTSGTSGWFLPSFYQWNMIVKGLSGQSADLSWDENDNYNASSLNTKIEAAGGTGLLSFGYWSSTEYDGDYALSFNAGFGSVNADTKSGYNNVRSAFAF